MNRAMRSQSIEVKSWDSSCPSGNPRGCVTLANRPPSLNLHFPNCEPGWWEPLVCFWTDGS